MSHVLSGAASRPSPSHRPPCRFCGRPLTTTVVEQLRNRELAPGLNNLSTYQRFREQVKEAKREILKFLITAKSQGKRIVGFSASGKGSTLLNCRRIRTDFHTLLSTATH